MPFSICRWSLSVKERGGTEGGTCPHGSGSIAQDQENTHWNQIGIRWSQVETPALSLPAMCAWTNGLAFESFGFLVSIMEMKSPPRRRKYTKRLVFSLEKM